MVLYSYEQRIMILLVFFLSFGGGLICWNWMIVGDLTE